jgi:hypothetical protein
MLLDTFESDPEGVRDQMLAALQVLPDPADESLTALANAVLRLTDPAGVKIGRYVVDARESRGIVIGDNARQENKFY